jgi:hypothetical protein
MEDNVAAGAVRMEIVEVCQESLDGVEVCSQPARRTHGIVEAAMFTAIRMRIKQAGDEITASVLCTVYEWLLRTWTRTWTWTWTGGVEVVCGLAKRL